MQNYKIYLYTPEFIKILQKILLKPFKTIDMKGAHVYNLHSLVLVNKKFNRGTRMELGDKIKQLRLQCDLTQEELANRCELSKGYISQLENDLTSPSIATLTDILTALGTTLKDFFTEEEEEEKIVFSENDFIEKITDEMTLNWLVPNAQKNIMEPLLIKLEPLNQTSEDVPHDGEEFGYVLSGEITLHLGKKKYAVKKGESFYFKADKIHYIINTKKDAASFIWISSPPSF